ncbi:MAG: hypothetical protein C0592_08040 [Marinilabiliales bacterium]|nr:MAG: hypothetical protein C0592_08040 [Marinilabiliales bacterium]
MKKVLTVAFVLLTVTLFAQEKIYTPTLVAPADSATTQKVNALLDWNPVSGAVYYEIQLDTNNGFSNPALLTSSYSAIGTSMLLFGQYYHWRVRAIDAAGDSSSWSSSRAFETIYRPTLSKPLDSARNVHVLSTMTINTMSGVSTYEWQFDSVNTFSSAWFKTDTFMSGKTFNTIRNLYGDQYFWRVRGMHDNDTSEWSLTYTFWTLDSVDLIDPDTGTVDFHPIDSLEFNSILGTTKYQLAFDTDTMFTAPFYQMADSSAIYITVSPNDTLAKVFADTLPYGTKFFWKVRLINPNDTSKWSNVFDLTTVGKVTMNTPADAAIDIPVTSSFDWDGIRGTDFYILEYDTVATFASATKVNVTGTSYTPASLLESQTDYYWRVRAANSTDTTSTWDEYSFTTYYGLSVEENSQIEWEIYPNPAYDYVNIILEGSSSASVEIINILGDVVLSRNSLRNGDNVITLSDLTPGMYMVRLYVDGDMSTTRLIKK